MIQQTTIDSELNKNDEIWYLVEFWDGLLEKPDHSIIRSRMFCNYKRAEKSMSILNDMGFCCKLTRTIRE